ncbi:MAG: endonuclease/exonuclease/phosphatase family protein [Chitinivibrionia bacterium]|nr:endonuclease/exonuclease/phosphatase family protein [Chitinivibrionia bacterium]
MFFAFGAQTRQIVSTFILVFLLSVCAFAKTLTVATYNVHNLFDLNHDGTEYDIFVPGVWNLTSYRIKLQNISYVISRLNADIIALQEVESQQALDDLSATLRRMGFRYYGAFAKNPRQAIGLAILSRYPIADVLQYPVPNSRPILRADIAIDDDTLSVFSVHFPSKRSPESRRIQAANVLRRAIDTLVVNQNFEYIIMGDFNSDFDEFARALSQETDNTSGRTGINHVLRTVRSKVGEKPEFSIPPLNDGEHFNPWTEVSAANRWSYIFRGNRNTLDHILFPANMTDTIGWRFVHGSKTHFTDPKIIKDGKPYEWQHNRSTGVHYNSGFSDHLAVVAQITNQNISQNPAPRDLDGLNGWITNHGLARINFVQNTEQGFPVFELSTNGNIPSTATVAKLIAVADKNYAPLQMAIRGAGTISVRSRIKSGEEQVRWSNASPATKEITGQARYHEFRSQNWTNFPLLPNVSAGDTVEIEIRAQGGSSLNIQFCVENLSGWHRHSRRGRR